MNRDESLQIVEMILTNWHGREWSKAEIDAYARLVQDMDAELTTSALIRAAKEMTYRPSVAELREYVRAEKRRLAPVVASPPPSQGQPLPFWVRRWICARILYDKFGKAKDDRRFPEQGDYGDLTKELMPEGAWEAEARELGDDDFASAFRAMLRGARLVKGETT